MQKVKGPLFKWFGSKWRAAAKYPTVPEGMTIVEPFAGSAAFALRYSNHPVHIYDCNEALQLLWPWLIGPATHADVMAIPTDLKVGQDIRDLDLCPEQMILLKLWQRTGRYADSDAAWKVSSWGGQPGQWTEACRARVAADVEKVKHWTFEPVDFTRVGYYLIDPPYQFNAYDYGTPINYERMVERIAEIPAGSLVVACEAACRKTGVVPDYLPFEHSHTSVTARRTYGSELIFTHGFAGDWREKLGPPRRSVLRSRKERKVRRTS